MATADVQSAFTYAWWLTGEDEAAARVVEAALDAAPSGATPQLLREVRERVEVAAMGPAAEVALLSDVAGVDLEEAAAIAGVSPADAPRLLASGRLESLPTSPDVEILHPERLGGLAVGARKDTNHAVGCRSCGRVAELLAQGRDELVAIATVPAPDALLARAAAAPIEAAPSGGGGAPAPTEPETGAGVQSPLPEVEPAAVVADEPEAPAPLVPEPEEAAESGPVPEAEQVAVAEVAPHDPALLEDETSARPRIALLLVALGVAVLVVVVILLLQPSPGPRVDDGVDGGASEETAGLDAGEETVAQTDAAVPPEPADAATDAAPPDAEPGADGEFEVLAAGVLIGDEEDAAASGAQLAPDEPIRLAVDYRGAQEGVTLAAEWTADGELFRAMEVLLSRARGRHLFVAPVPEGGWPAGAHHVVFSAGGDVVGSADFLITDAV